MLSDINLVLCYVLSQYHNYWPGDVRIVWPSWAAASLSSFSGCPPDFAQLRRLNGRVLPVVPLCLRHGPNNYKDTKPKALIQKVLFKILGPPNKIFISWNYPFKQGNNSAIPELSLSSSSLDNSCWNCYRIFLSQKYILPYNVPLSRNMITFNVTYRG
jgi:hypothetical protein